MIRSVLPCCFALAVAAPLATQNSCPDGGLGGIETVIDLPSVTATDGHVGVQRLGARYYVAARRRNAVAMHRIYVLDADGLPVTGADFDQPAALAASSWGLRDLTTDGICLFGGSELGVLGIDVAGAPCSSIVTQNGARAFSGPIGGAALALLGTFRALAYDPSGNGGEGSFWAANLERELVELDRQGNVLRAHPNVDGWCIQGLAFDPCTNTLWAYALPDQGPIVEIDPATGRPTGRRIDAFVHGSQAGVSVFVEGVGRRLAWIAQGDRDQLVVASLYAVDGACDAAELLVGIDGGQRERRFAVAQAGSTTMELALAGGTAGMPGVIFVNLGADALQCGDVAWLGPAWSTLADFVAVTPFSSPTGLAVELPTTTGAMLSVPLNALPQSTALRAQAVYLEPAVLPGHPGQLAVLPTNEIEVAVERRTPKGVTASANGFDSLRGDTVAGFFRVRNDSSDPIVRVVFEAVGGMHFDYDQETGSGAAWAGNSVAGPACCGTYRAGSDILTGLHYAMTPAAGCDASARRGFLESGEAGSTLTFPFTGGMFANGATFAFDCDTDDGRGATARDMDGMRVRITFGSGDIRVGVLRADPSGAMRASAGF